MFSGFSKTNDQSLRYELTHLSTKLKSLHKDLLSFQTRDVERHDGRKYNPYDLFQMSINDQRYSWMRRLSRMISQIDEVISHDDEGLQPFELNAIIADVQELLGNAHPDFSVTYHAALAADPNLTILDVEVKRALKRLRPYLRPLL